MFGTEDYTDVISHEHMRTDLKESFQKNVQPAVVLHISSYFHLRRWKTLHWLLKWHTMFWFH